MAGTKYEVVYVARSPASMQQDEFAAMVDELCNGRSGEGWSLISTAGDYGANLTLGVWLYFAREAASALDESLVETGADEDVAPAADEDVAPAADEDVETGADEDVAPAAGLDEDSDESLIETGADEDVAPAAGLDEDSGESPEPAEGEAEESTEETSRWP